MDCVAVLGKTLSLIDWKTSERAKPTVASLYDNPLQVVAYLGIFYFLVFLFIFVCINLFFCCSEYIFLNEILLSIKNPVGMFCPVFITITKRK